MVEWRAGQSSPSPVRELFCRPVLQRGLLIVEEYAAILYRRRAMGATTWSNEECGMCGCRYISPPENL
jgi:hypothetical protein